MNILNRIKELRLKANLTLREVEKKTGYGYAFLSRLENGKITLSNDVADKLANFFNVSTDYLLGKSVDERFEEFLIGLNKDYYYLSRTYSSELSKMEKVIKALEEIKNI